MTGIKAQFNRAFRSISERWRTIYLLTSKSGNAARWGLAIALISFSAGCGGINFPNIPWPRPTPTPTPAPTPTPEPPPGDVCSAESNLLCACWANDNGSWIFVPCPEPTPTPEPTPPPSSNYWRESDDFDNCSRIGDDGLNRRLVEEVLDELVASGSVSFPTSLSESQLYGLMGPGLDARGLLGALYGEELAVSGQQLSSENYDLLLSSGNRRTGASTYRSTCKPATRSAPLVDRSQYPTSVDEIRIKWHNGWADATALHRNVPPDPNFPVSRQHVPACGPEGPGHFDCSQSIPPRWEGPGIVNPNNVWLFKPDDQPVRACVNLVCSPWLR